MMKNFCSLVAAMAVVLGVGLVASPAEAHGHHGHHGHRGQHGHSGHHGHPCKWRTIRINHHWVNQNNCVATWNTLHD